MTFRARRPLAAALLAACVLALGGGQASARQSSWQPVHLRGQAARADWYDVSCPDSETCLAVGAIGSKGLTLVEHHGRRTVDRQRDILASLSCRSSNWCLGSGWTLARTFSRRWTGSSWTAAERVSEGGLYGPMPLRTVCVSRRSCYAYGSQEVSTSVDCPTNSASGYCDTSEPYLTHWNGRLWQRVSGLPLPAPITTPRVPVPSLGPAVTLDSFACAGPLHCVAVGGWYTGGVSSGGTATSLYADVLKGRRWSLTRIPVPGGATNARLGSVSCAAAGRCVAVGSFDAAVSFDQTASMSLVARWNGHRWSTTTDLPDGEVNAVSCVRRGPCVIAAGVRSGHGGRIRPVTLVMRSGHWATRRVTPPPRLRQRHGATLTAISCATAGRCEAIGRYGKLDPRTGEYPTFVERYAP